MSALTWLLVGLSTLILTSNAAGQKPPSLGYVYPPVIRAGATTEVKLGGYDFTPDMQFFAHDDRVVLDVGNELSDYFVPPPPYWTGPRAGSPAMPIPRELSARITIPADFPESVVRWQVANANGASNTALFYVSHGSEQFESRSRDFPQALGSLPVAVSGRLERLTEVDRYTITSEHEGPISVELFARRLGSDFHAVLQVQDASGKVVAEEADTAGFDVGLTFHGRANEVYTIGIHDVDFRGDRAYVYRLHVRRGPRIVGTVPSAGQRGTQQEMEFVGWSLDGNALQLGVLRDLVRFPSDPAQAMHVHTLTTAHGELPVPIWLSDLPELRPSTEASQPVMPLAGPSAVTRRLPADVEQHRYTWSSRAGESWSVAALSRAIGGPLDLMITVMDPDGAVIADSDDSQWTSDASVSFTASADGEYSCAVRDLTQRQGTPGELYRLELRRLEPDFALSVAKQAFDVPLGGSTELLVTVERTAGFTEPIELQVDELPRGVSIEGELIVPAGAAQHKLTVKAAEDADVVARVFGLRGRAKVGDAERVKGAIAVAKGSLCPGSESEMQTTTLLLAVTMAPPFSLELVDGERQREVPRGSTALAEFLIHRTDGFAGEIELQMAAQQSRYRQGIVGPTVRVPGDHDRAVYPSFMPEWLATDLTRRMVVQGVAAVADPAGNLRYLVQPANARITMILEGALLKISAPTRRFAVELGESFEIPIEVLRSATLPLDAQVELHIPEEINGLIESEPLTLSRGTDKAVLRVQSRADDRLIGPWSLRITATALADGRWPVVSELTVDVEFATKDLRTVRSK